MVVAARQEEVVGGIEKSGSAHAGPTDRGNGFQRRHGQPDRRGQHLSTEMGRYSREVLEEWSRANPNERVMGMGTTIQTTNLDEKKKRPIWKASGLVFVGYSAQDQQIRVAWFDHAEIE